MTSSRAYGQQRAPAVCQAAPLWARQHLLCARRHPSGPGSAYCVPSGSPWARQHLLCARRLPSGPGSTYCVPGGSPLGQALLQASSVLRCIESSREQLSYDGQAKCKDYTTSNKMINSKHRTSTLSFQKGAGREGGREREKILSSLEF